MDDTLGIPSNCDWDKDELDASAGAYRYIKVADAERNTLVVAVT